uniref:Essential for reactive oxygen species protein n=1 Tax=Oncorhynchus tshawytscha TaxID=74940 RepID=A0AAZ3PI22_ONCTS
MGYMQVEEHTTNMLHLKRSPGIRSWSLLIGIASIGLAAAYYSSDSILWKLFYVTGCLFVAMQNMEEWEEGGAVAVPGGDTARQDALDCASVEVCECFW